MFATRLCAASLFGIMCVCACAIVLPQACLAGPFRTQRDHSKVTTPQFEFLARRIGFSGDSERSLTQVGAEQDLDELEWLLGNRYSYLRRTGVDYRAALDAIRLSAAGGTTRGTLAVQLMKLLALFGDGHSGIEGPHFKRMCPKYLPFLVAEAGSKLIALRSDRSGFLDPAHPVLVSLDGLDPARYLEAAGRTVPKGSAQFVRNESIRNLRYIQYLRKELALPDSRDVLVELAPFCGDSRSQAKLPLVDQPPVYGVWPATTSRILSGNIGYLRIAMMEDNPPFLAELTTWMTRFRRTDGLVIDIRGNGGGSRAALRALLPYFLDDDAPPRVANVAAVRLGHDTKELQDRWLCPARWSGWTPSEQATIAAFAQGFRPEWTPPAGDFSEWHYLVISASRKRGCYHYDRPVIILMNTDNYSAADIFLAACKGLANITLMGTPSGGGSGRFQSYTLHHSAIRVRLSSIASFQPDGRLYDGNGVQPDILAEATPDDLIGRTDSILDAARARLAKAPSTAPASGPAGSKQ